MLPLVEEHLSQFDEVDEFQLCTRDAESLRDFLQSTSFTPILKAMDTDYERVANTELQEIMKMELKD